MRVMVLADTHLGAGLERLPPSALEALDAADVVLHAGDVVSSTALDALSERGPLHAVLGNNDHELVGALPTTLSLELAGPCAGRRIGLFVRFRSRVAGMGRDPAAAGPDPFWRP